MLLEFPLYHHSESKTIVRITRKIKRTKLWGDLWDGREGGRERGTGLKDRLDGERGRKRGTMKGRR